MAMAVAEAGREAAGGDDADRRLPAASAISAPSRAGRAFQHLQPHADAREGPSASSRHDPRRRRGSRRASRRRLLHGEGQARLDRRGGLVQVVAVERQAGLQPQRVAGAQADGLHPLVGQQRVPEGRRRARRGPGSRSRPRRCSRSARWSGPSGRSRWRRRTVMKTRSAALGHERRDHGARPRAPAARSARGRPCADQRGALGRRPCRSAAKSSSLVPALTTM